MHEKNRSNPLALQVFIFIVLLVGNVADTNPKKKTTCLDTCDLHRYDTTLAQVKAKHDKFFSTVGVPCPPPGFLCLVCDFSIGKNLSCDSRAYIMDFCYRNNPKAYILNESFNDCEKHCPDSACMQMLLFKKWGLSRNLLNTGRRINRMNHNDCFFEEPLDTVTENTRDTTDQVEQKPFEIALTVICLTLSSFIIIVILVHVIYLQERNRINKFGKSYWRKTKEFKTEIPIEESIDTKVRRAFPSPRMQDRLSFPVYDKLCYIDSDQNEDL